VARMNDISRPMEAATAAPYEVVVDEGRSEQISGPVMVI